MKVAVLGLGLLAAIGFFVWNRQNQIKPTDFCQHEIVNSMIPIAATGERTSIKNQSDLKKVVGKYLEQAKTSPACRNLKIEVRDIDFTKSKLGADLSLTLDGVPADFSVNIGRRGP